MPQEFGNFDRGLGIKYLFRYILASLIVTLSMFIPAKVYATPLRWAPPTLVNPQTINLGTGWTSNTLDANTDYIINMPVTAKQNQTVLVGGHNIQIIGGWAYLSAGSGSTSIINISGATGTVHIEGLLITNPNSKNFDGITIQDSPLATLQVENVRMLGLIGDATGFHADMFQIYNGSSTPGLASLKFDHFTASSNYQGIMIADNANNLLGSAQLQNVNLSYSGAPVHTTSTFLLWLTQGLTDCTTSPTDLQNFYILPRDGQTIGGNGAWPTTSSPAGCPSVENNSIVTWPNLSSITGSVIDGAPSADFAPGGTPGLGIPGIGYVSPGYDTTDPTISNIVVLPNQTGATITWTTSEAASTKINYGTTSSYGTDTAITDNLTGVTSHSVVISGLSLCTKYHYRVRSEDQVLREVVSSDNAFTTDGCSGSSSSSSDTTVDNPSSHSFPDLFQIDATKNKATLYFSPASMPYDKYIIRYGSNKNSLSYATTYSTGYVPGVARYVLNELLPNTIYYFQIRAGNGNKFGGWGNIMSAKTTGSNNATTKSYKSSGELPKSQATAILSKNPVNAIKNSALIPSVAPKAINQKKPITGQKPNTASKPTQKKCILFICW